MGAGVPQGSGLAPLTVDVVVHPGEGDGPLFAALAEPQQEGPGTFVAEQSLLPLLTEEAYDGTSHRENQEVTFKKQSPNIHLRVLTHPSFQRDSRCLLIRSRIPSIHSQKGNAFSLALCFRIP